MISDKGGVPRLGVPPFGHTECTHGTLNDGTILTTLFPQALTFARRSVLLKEYKKISVLCKYTAFIFSGFFYMTYFR